MQTANAIKNINISNLRSDLTNILNEVQYNRDGVIVNRFGKPAVAIVPLFVYQKWEADWDQLFELFDQAQNNVPDDFTDEEVMDLVLEAQQAVCAEMAQEK